MKVRERWWWMRRGWGRGIVGFEEGGRGGGFREGEERMKLGKRLPSPGLLGWVVKV